jgi:hypothetical protein
MPAQRHRHSHFPEWVDANGLRCKGALVKQFHRARESKALA